MKRLLALVLVLFLCLSAVSVASACGKYNEARYQNARNIAYAANCKIAALVFAAQLTPYDDTALLVYSTNAVAASAKYQIAKLGFEAGCTYTTYLVDGKYITIDPLYVINPLPDKKKDNDDEGNG